MPSIVSLRVEDRLLELITPETQQVGKLFEADSINLILGKNGAGKTRLLNLVAEAVSSPDRRDASVYVADVDGNVTTLSSRHNDFCAIYYSGLPYRRRFKSQTGIIDASPVTKEKETIEKKYAKLTQFSSIASALGEDVQLTANLEYSGNIFRSIFIPALKKENLRVINSTLESLIIELKEAERTPITGVESLKILDRAVDKCRKNLSNFLREYIRDWFSNEASIYHLAAVEYLYVESGEKDAYPLALMDSIGLVEAGLSHEETDKIFYLVHQSFELVELYGQAVKSDQSSISFSIFGVEQIDAIGRYESPFRIEWFKLSSGLQALVDQFGNIGDAVAKAVKRGRRSILLLIDEGDAYLHLDWQRKYLTLLDKYLGELQNAQRLNSLQVILATHSPIIAADMPGLFVTNMGFTATTKTFGAPIEQVIAGSFDSNSLGLFAATKINELYAKALEKRLTEIDSNLIDQIGDNAIRSVIRKGEQS